MTLNLTPITPGTLTLTGTASGSIAIGPVFTVTDGSTDVSQPGTLKFSGATVTESPAGTALVTVAGGGSQPTDEVFSITEDGVPPTLLPIVGLSQDDATVTVDGDHAAIFNEILTAAPGSALAVISGSTGNDGAFGFTAAVYDGDADQTTLTTAPAPPDPTVDGTVTLPVVTVAEFVLPSNSAVEWVYVETTEDWDGSNLYWTIGDEDEPGAFAKDNNGFYYVSTWQWPRLTLHKDSGGELLVGGTAGGYKLYPDGTTIKIFIASYPPGGGLTGKTNAVVHHHFTEPVVPA